MRTLGIVLSVLVLTGCASKERMIPVGSTVVADTTGGKGPDVYSYCDERGNLLYMTKDKNGPLLAVQGGCKKPEPIERVGAPSQPIAPPPPQIEIPPVVVQFPSSMQIQLPQPLQVQLVNPPQAAQLPQPEPPAAVQIPAPAPAPTARATKGIPWRLDPNTASVDDLERLPGVTAKDAAAIVKGRPYRTLRELVDKRALTSAQLDLVTPYVIIR